MLFCSRTAITVTTAASTADAGTTASTADAGKIRLGGGYRLPVSTADAGKVRLGGGYRLSIRAT